MSLDRSQKDTMNPQKKLETGGPRSLKHAIRYCQAV